MYPLLTTLEWHGIQRPIGSYGVLLAIALLVGCGLAVRAAHRAGGDTGALIAALAGAVGCGFVGAYAWSVLTLRVQLGSFEAAFAHAGIVFYGGLAVGALSLCGWARLFGLSPLRTLDWMLPGLPVAHAIGRIGCLLGGCCYGEHTELPWALSYGALGLRHPWPVYEALALLVLAGAFWSPRRFASYPGSRALAYVSAYACVRFALEPWRGDSIRGVWLQGWLSSAQVVSLLWLLGSWVFRRVRSVGWASMSKAWFGAIVLGAGLSWAAWAAADDTGTQPRWASLEATQVSAARVRITGGWFVMGSDDAEIARARALCTGEPCNAEAFAAEQPAHRVYVRAFEIDRTEVSNAAYQRCVNRGRCFPPREQASLPAPADHPVVQLTFAEARAYCRFAGGDLPTEAQWEYAARGSSARSFPWGQAWNAGLGAFAAGPQQAGELRSVSANADGKSFFGLLNMAGNVWEFVLDSYRAPYDVALPNVDPAAEPSTGQSSERVLRGGSWQSPPHTLRARYRAAIREDEARSDVGLRCAYPAR
jgi:formylglycine-generating enzyme required for sulfatase activity/prolipoprotein diacylglyceryltransferase